MILLSVPDILQILCSLYGLIFTTTHLSAKNLPIACNLRLDLLERCLCNSTGQFLRFLLLLLSLNRLNLGDMAPEQLIEKMS